MTEERNHLMVTISRPERPGITASLTRVLVDHHVDILPRVPLSEGIEGLVTTLKWLGYRLGIVTGGLDFAHANRLEIKGASSQEGSWAG